MAANRTRGLVVVLALVVVAAGGGWIAGQRVKSPADAAADAAPPPASRITVPVEERALSSDLVLRGTVQYAQPTPVGLAGAVGTSAGTGSAVLTRAPEAGGEITDGQVVMEVSGRPVFAVQGAQPTFRQITPRSTGPDVRQLEEALQRLGFAPGAVDGTYDDATEAAVDRWYEAAGYASQGPTEEQRRSLRDLRKAVTDAQERVTEAQKALAAASSGLKQSELLRLQKGVSDAEDALVSARQVAQRNNDEARLTVAERTKDRDAAIAARDAADLAVANATAPGAVDPDTGNPYTDAQITALRSDATAKRSAVTAAQQALDNATAQVAVVRTDGEKAVANAQEAIDIAKAELAEAQQPKDPEAERKAVADATEALAQSQRDLAELEATVGTVVPAGEILFFPVLPLRIDSVQAKLGDVVSGELMTVTGSRLAVDASVAKADARLLTMGAAAVIDVTDLGIELTGTISQIADKAGTNGVSDSRVYVQITPDDTSRAAEVANTSARIRVPIESTGGEVLAVPIAALSTGGDGSTRVQVERDADVETVAVRVGLTAQGYVQVTPVDGASLKKGDRVVVGKKEADETSDGESEDGTSEAQG